MEKSSGAGEFDAIEFVEEEPLWFPYPRAKLSFGKKRKI